MCSPLRKLKGSQCEVTYKRIAGVVYVFKARLYPTGNQTWFVSQRVVRDLFEVFFYVRFFHEYSLQMKDYSRYVTICYRTINEFTTTVCHNTGVFSVICNPKLNFYEIELHIQVTEYHSFADILERYKNMTESAIVFSIDLGNVTHQYQIRYQVFEHTNKNITIGSSEGHCSNKSEKIILSQQSGCAFIELRSTEYEWVIKEGVVYIKTLNVEVLNQSQYQFGPNKSSLFVCSETYIQLFHVHELRIGGLKTSDYAVIVSMLCVSLSLVCLLLSSITFCIFPSLRSLPGKNNLALIFSLLCAQTLYLIGSYAKFEQDSVVCITLGVCTHFMWLVAIFWMNICTYHVYRVFTGPVSVSTGRHVKTLIIYSSYVMTVSTILVLVNVLVSFLTSDYTDIGYGKISCYINSGTMIIFTFCVPVGFVVITNLVMFIICICKVIKTPKIRRNVKHERNDIIIFAKLSTLTGLCWVFGFVYILTDIEAFSYLFIISNASQGIFIFLSFVCTGKVMNMYRDKVGLILTESGSFRTTSTDDKSPGKKYIASQ